MQTGWSAKIGASLMWLVTSALAIVVLFVGANLYQLFLFETLQISRWSNTLWLDLYFVLAGVAWLGFAVLMQTYLYKAGFWLRRGMHVGGIELLMIGLMHLGMDAYHRFQSTSVILGIAELLLGGALFWLARRLNRRAMPKR